MGVFEWIGVVEMIGLGVLAVIVWLVMRRSDRQAQAGDAANGGTGAIPMEQPDFPSAGDAGGT